MFQFHDDIKEGVIERRSCCKLTAGNLKIEMIVLPPIPAPMHPSLKPQIVRLSIETQSRTTSSFLTYLIASPLNNLHGITGGLLYAPPATMASIETPRLLSICPPAQENLTVYPPNLPLLAVFATQNPGSILYSSCSHPVLKAYSTRSHSPMEKFLRDNT